MTKRTRLPLEIKDRICLSVLYRVPDAAIARILRVSPITVRKYRIKILENEQQERISPNESLRRIIRGWAKNKGSGKETADFLYEAFIAPFLGGICEELRPIASFFAYPQNPTEWLCEMIFGRVDLDQLVTQWFEEEILKDEYRPTAIRERIKSRIRAGEILPDWQARADAINAVWDQLLPREAEVLRAYCGSGAERIRKDQEVADMLGVSTSRTNSIKHTACCKMQEIMRTQQGSLTWANIAFFKQQVEQRLKEQEKRLLQTESELADLRRRLDTIAAIASNSMAPDQLPPDSPDNSEIPITDICFTVRTHGCLVKTGIKTLGDLANCTEADLLSIRNFGQKCLDEIKAKLATFGLKLAG
ncbi:MAG: DNA-directed RNA polymerase subunit alpha [Candidatus Berkelbacteria bacterium Licking1014_7]|uniref:DNA-directed RNA polymerase subunit alpha n=1 Tax=Candidatus Berkelbacteria bacterium Licking1014_7 TaxID=2017147 RepID=A0A554LHZ4_9BACT|nr:MAG: DNA-directed RNA polymerase subunit alpha [Candidatus Berkelbacteria bacterium Licking1014_7]